MARSPARRSDVSWANLEFLSSPQVLAHAGEWVAVLDRRVIASGKTLARVRELVFAMKLARAPTFYPVPTDVVTIYTT